MFILVGEENIMEVHVNPFIKNTVRIFPEQGRYEYHRYDMNENPEGLPQDFVKDVLEDITPEFLAIYPEPNRFVNKLANFLSVKSNNILTTNGSDMAIRYILETFGEVGKEVVTVSPSFEMYWVNCNILGYKHVPVTYNTDLSISIDKICKAITQDTRVVVLLNPNNPVGNVYSEVEVEKVIDVAARVGAVVVIDEAYHYFYKKTFLNYAIEKENVIILRTFSKLFSLAACRLGIILSSSKLIDYIRKTRLTFDVNSVALLFAERLIERPDIIEKLINIENEGRAYALKELRNAGYECRDCKGNFIFIKPKMSAKLITKKLKECKKILVHDYSNELLKDYIRVSTGSKKAMEFFLNAFFELDE